jgi:hypothetical protein
MPAYARTHPHKAETAHAHAYMPAVELAHARNSDRSAKELMGAW